MLCGTISFKFLTQALLSYCGLVDARINASDKDLPVHGFLLTQLFFQSLKEQRKRRTLRMYTLTYS